MKFKCYQQDLAKALSIVSKAVTGKTTIPILKGILLEVSDDNKLTLLASDMDITIENTIEVEEAQPGSVVVISKLFSDIIRKFPNDIVTVELIDDRISVTCRNSNFTIKGMPADEFPKISSNQEELEEIIFDKETLKTLIPRTSFAASSDMSKGVITGILTELEHDSIKMVAIDGYRMAISKENMINTSEHSFVISSKIMDEINKIISEAGADTDKIKLMIDDTNAVFSINQIKVILRLLDGQFIKYKDIIPGNTQIAVTVNRSDLAKSIDRASLLSTEGKNNLIKFDIRDNIMTITSESEEGTVEEDILIKKEGNDLTIGFNSKYIQDVLKVIDDEEIVIKLNTSITPCLIEPVAGDEYTYLILPVRITN